MINNRPLYYTKPGKAPGGPCLLLIHGAGGSHLDWPKAIQHLDGLNVINLDLPGHGRSPGSGYTEIGRYADDVDTFARTLELDDVCVAGHSMGGAIAQMLALDKPCWLSSVVLIGTSACLPVTPRILENLLTNPSQAINLVMRYSWTDESPSELVDLAMANMSAVDPGILFRDFTSCDCFDVRDKLAEIRLPTLVISGKNDRMTPVEDGRKLASSIRDSRFVVIENAGHYVTLERPQLVAEAIGAFITEVSSASQQHA